MDTFDTTLTRILERIQASALPDEKKADVYAQITVGLQKLVWPVLLARMPEDKLRDYVDNSALTVEKYNELISAALTDPETPEELHSQIMSVLTEIDALLTTNGIA